MERRTQMVLGGGLAAIGLVLGGPEAVNFAERTIPPNALWPHKSSPEAVAPQIGHITVAGAKDMPCKPGEVIKQVDTTRKQVALTIDDGPSPSQMPRILDVLKKTDSHATFFFVGNRLQTPQGKTLAQQAIQQGNEVAMHSYSHRIYDHNRRTGEWEKAGDINAAEQSKAIAAFKDAVGDVPYAYRAPGFKYTDALRKKVRNTGQCFIDMSYDPKLVDANQDDTHPNSKALRNLEKMDTKIINDLAPGKIILVHDAMRDQPNDGGKNRARQKAPDHIEFLIRGIQAKGYDVVSVETLLRDARADKH